MVGEKVWLATLDDRTRDTHRLLHDQRVPLDGTFKTVDGASAIAPGQFGVAGEDINCRCTMEAIVTGFNEETGTMPQIDMATNPPEPPVPPSVPEPQMTSVPAIESIDLTGNQ